MQISPEGLLVLRNVIIGFHADERRRAGARALATSPKAEGADNVPIKQHI